MTSDLQGWVLRTYLSYLPVSNLASVGKLAVCDRDSRPLKGVFEMRVLRILLAGALLASLSVLAWGAPAMARSAKAPAQILSITAMRTATTLDIVVRTTAVPANDRMTERVYFYDSTSGYITQCGIITSLHSGAGTGTSDTNPYSAVIPDGTKFVRVEAVLSAPGPKRTYAAVHTVNSGAVEIPPASDSGPVPMTIWAK